MLQSESYQVVDIRAGSTTLTSVCIPRRHILQPSGRQWESSRGLRVMSEQSPI